MQLIGSLLDSYPYIDVPFDLLGWVGLLALAACAGFLAWRLWEKENRTYGQYIFFVVLVGAELLFSIVLGLRFPAESALPLPGMPVEIQPPVLMFFAALPWVLAAGLLGPQFALFLAVLSGVMTALWESHSYFPAIELAGLALLYSFAVRQRYRTRLFSFLRHPLGAGFALPLLYIPVFLVFAFFETNGSIAIRLDYALTQRWDAILALWLEILLASVPVQFLYIIRLKYWGRSGPLIASPSETSLSKRFIYGMVPLFVISILALLIGDWVFAGNAVRRMIHDRLSSSASVAAESLPYFLETGQSLILSMADPELATIPADQINNALGERLRQVPYFRKLILYDTNGALIAVYPSELTQTTHLTEQETAGVNLALNGVSIQTYTIPPEAGLATAEVSFIALINDSQGNPAGVLIGHTDLESNPFTQPAIEALKTIKESGGEGLILDEDHRVLYNTSSAMLISEYNSTLPAEGVFSDNVSPFGTRQYVYYKLMKGRPWGVVLTYPAAKAQEMALEISIPLLLILVGITLTIFIILQVVIRVITSSLRSLSKETALIAQGQLDHPLQLNQADEVGQFSLAFEQMRLSLKARLDELGSLLVVSQGVAASLDVAESIQAVLNAALGPDALLVRVALVKETSIEATSDRIVSFGVGPESETHAYLDHQIFELMREQKLLTIPNTIRLRRLQFIPQIQAPGALIAAALYRENKYYGVLWAAYPRPRVFTEAEERFVSTLAGQAALAAANAGLYATAEIGRQRMEAVLDSTPEPVLVIDGQMKLLLLNPAARQVPGLMVNPESGKQVQDVISIPPLLDFITQPIKDKLVTREITLPNGRIYFASLSSVVARGQSVGKVCILRDITYYKELDTIKSDFVSTVSHDLRSPLTLIRGYTTMLEMVGPLNDQQISYVRKIILGVDNMGHLVNNLLDLGRIEQGIGLKIARVVAVDMVENVINSLQPQAVQKDIQLKNNVQVNKSVILDADPALLQQALYNLVENAIKYTAVGGKVEVRVQVMPKTIIYEVHDTGMGIAPLDLPHMFEKFYRSGRRESYRQRGTGLGLAIVKSIIERHGGSVRVESTLGKGSTFSFEVPLENEKATKPD